MIVVLIACSQTIFLFFPRNLASERACERSVRVKAIAEQWQNIPLRYWSISPRGFSFQTHTRSTISKEEMEGL